MEVEELILENNWLTELDPKCFELLFSNLEKDQREVWEINLQTSFSLLSAGSILSEIMLFVQELAAKVPLHFCHNVTVLSFEFLCLLVSLYILKNIFS